MDYEKKYNEALKRAKQFMSEHPTMAEADLMVALFPELCESEDERIRKAIIHYLDYTAGGLSTEEQHKWIAYLEKQKINTEGDFGRGYDCGYEACLNSHGAEWFEKLKEPHFTKRNALFDKCVKNCDPEIMKRVSDEIDAMLGKEQKPNIELIQRSWYMEGYHDGKFGNEPKWVIKTGEGGPKYEENPKYGQMLKAEQKPAEWEDYKDKVNIPYCSSEPELCDKLDIDTLREWSMRYAPDIREAIEATAYHFYNIHPHWKPSEEQMEELLNALIPGKDFDCDVLSELYEQLKKLM